MANQAYRPSTAFIGASWATLLLGAAAFIVGLWNANVTRSEKGFYFIVLMYGLFAAVSLQKSIRDKLEDVRVSNQYFMMCWASLIICIVLFGYGLFNADPKVLQLSEKGFFGISFMMALFGAIAVQKNTRDVAAANG